MTSSPVFDFDYFLDVLAEKVAGKLRPQLSSAEGIKPRLLTVEEAGRYLGRSRESVQHLIAEGKLPTVRADRRVFLDIRDLDAWIETNKTEGC